MNNIVFGFEIPANEPVQSFAPGSADRDAVRRELAALSAREAEIPLVIGGKEVRTGVLADVRNPCRHGHVLARVHQAGEAEVEAGHRRRPGGQARLGDDVVGRAGLDHAQGRRPARHEVPLPDPRGDDARAGQERLPGRDRRGLRDDRLPALQRLLRLADLRGPAALRVRPAQPPGVPAARGVRPHREPVQLHRDRVEPQHGAGADGQHDGLEARVHRRSCRRTSSCRSSGRPACPTASINFVPGSGSLIGRVALAHRDLAGLHFTGSNATFNQLWRGVAEHLDRYRRLPAHRRARPAARTSSSCTRPPTRGEVATAHRPRRLRVPGAEVLGRLARLHPAVALAGDRSRRCSTMIGADPRRRRRATSATS